MIIKQLSVTDLKAKIDNQESLLLLDVREIGEYQYAHIDNSVLIPLAEIPHRLNELNKQQTIVVICHHGFRSQQIALYLKHSGFDDIANLKGGVDAWALFCDTSMLRY